MDLSSVIRLMSLSRVTGVFMLFFAGWLVDRFGPRPVMLGIGIVVGSATAAVGLLRGPVLMTAVFIQPMLVSSFFPAAFSGLARITARENYNLAISSMVPMSFLFGGGIVPLVMGALGDHASFSLGFVLLGAAFLCSLLLLRFLRIPGSGGFG